MKHLILSVLTLAFFALVVSEAWAQRPPGRGPGGFGGTGAGNANLLAEKSIQEELKLSQDQILQVTEKIEKQRGALGKLRDLSREEREKKMAERAQASQELVASILTEDQLKRFKQISWQQHPLGAFTDPEVDQALHLTSEQKEAIRSIQKTTHAEMQELMQEGGGSGDRKALREKFQAMRQATHEKLLAVLSTEQQAQWKALTGEPFKGELQGPPFRGGPRSSDTSRRPA